MSDIITINQPFYYIYMSTGSIIFKLKIIFKKMQKTVTIIDISDRSASGKTRSFHRSHILQMQCDVKLKLAFGVASS